MVAIISSTTLGNTKVTYPFSCLKKTWGLCLDCCNPNLSNDLSD